MEFWLGRVGIACRRLSEAGYIAQIGLRPICIDILNDIEELPFAEAKENRQTIEVDGLDVFYIGLHDFIKKKAGQRTETIITLEERASKRQITL